MNIESEIIATVVKAVKECYGQDVPTTMVQLQKTKAEFEGNLTLVVFPFLKVSKLKPEDTAQQLGEYLAQHCKVVQSFNVVKGFLTSPSLLLPGLACLTALIATLYLDKKRPTNNHRS